MERVRRSAGDRQPARVGGPAARGGGGGRRAASPHWRELRGARRGLRAAPARSPCPSCSAAPGCASTLTLEPERVVAGESVAAGVDVTNIASRRLLPTLLELPVGQAAHRYGIPLLAAGATHEESFTVRTERRGVIAVGPATTRRGDPLSLFSRDVTWTGVTEILVRPPMVPLDSLGAGLLRDLEGVPTDAVSHSDLAFHALREYVPGDDLRHIHWRSSAKAMASAGESQLLVRQYLDTRRSHATIVVDDAAPAWADGEDFETAMSLAASLAVRAVLDDFETSFVCGEHASTGSDGNRALDAVCRAVLSPAGSRTGLVAAARRAAAVAPDTSLLFLVSGSATALRHLPPRGGVVPARGAPLRRARRPRRHQPGGRGLRAAGASGRRQGRPGRPAPLERPVSAPAPTPGPPGCTHVGPLAPDPGRAGGRRLPARPVRRGAARTGADVHRLRLRRGRRRRGAGRDRPRPRDQHAADGPRSRPCCSPSSRSSCSAGRSACARTAPSRRRRTPWAC